MAAEPKKVKTRIALINLKRDPPALLYEVELTSGGGSWPENFGSKHELEIFLRGVLAGTSMADAQLEGAEIPRNPTHELVQSSMVKLR